MRFDGGDIERAITLGSLDLTLNLMFDEWGFEVLVFRSFAKFWSSGYALLRRQ
jgi:hypothetical protein